MVHLLQDKTIKLDSDVYEFYRTKYAVNREIGAKVREALLNFAKENGYEEKL